MKRTILLIIFLFVWMVGCNNQNPNDDNEHEHTYQEGWSYDEESHYHNSTCEHDLKKDIEKHDFKIKEEKKATHSEKGTIKYICSVCDYTYMEEIEKTPHTYSSEYLYDETEHYYLCECGEKKDVEEHNYGEGEVVIKETYFTDGLKLYNCVCGSQKEEVIPRIEINVDNNKQIIYLVTTAPGVDISKSVGISWHCKDSGSYLVYQKEGCSEVVTVIPNEEYWSIEESYMTDNYQNKRYVCTIDLNNLEENSKYNYRIISGEVASNIMSFQTADSKASKYKFLSFVDFQYSENSTTINLVRKFVQNNPDAVLLTCSGDFTDEGYSEKSHRYLFDNSTFNSTILAFGVGDHEYWGTDESPIKMFKRPYSYNKLFNNPDNGCEGYLNSSYYFKYNTTLFAFLDCGDSNVSSSHEMFTKQAEWLDNVLSKEKGYEFIVVCMHKSLYGDPKQDSAVRKIAPVFTNVFDKYKVDLVISGHDHEYSRTKAIYAGVANDNGTVYLDLGNSGSKTRATGEEVKKSSLYAKYIDIKANNYSLGIVGTVENGILRIVVRDLKYNYIDTVDVVKKDR